MSGHGRNVGEIVLGDLDGFSLTPVDIDVIVLPRDHPHAIRDLPEASWGLEECRGIHKSPQSLVVVVVELHKV